MRRWSWVVALAMVVSACGGGDSGGGDDGLTSTTSDDGVTSTTSDDGLTTATIDGVVVTVEVPEGAVPDGTQIEITAGDIPAELAEMSDVTAYAFSLEPSGLEFSQSAAITFTLAAPADGGTPLASVIIEGGDGTATFVSAEVVRRGDSVEITALVDHFSQAYLVLPDGTEVILTPDLLQMQVGGSERSEIKFRQEESSFSPLSRHNYFYEAGFDFGVLPVASEFIAVAFASFGTVEVTCLAKTNGVIHNAYEVAVEDRESDFSGLDGITGRLAGATSANRIRLLGDIECDAASTDTPVQEQPPLPASLQAATPTSVDSVVNGRNVQVDVRFAGDAQALAEGGARQVGVLVHLFGDERLRVSASFRSFEGEARASGDVEYGLISETAKVEDAEATGEWVANDHLRINITTESVVVPDTAPHVTVSVQETPDTEILHFVFE